MSRSFALATLIAALCATAAPARPPVSFDGFFGGLLDGCAVSGAFKTYSDAVQDRVQGRRKADAVAPRDLAGALGRARVADRGEYTSVEIDAKGVFHGLATRTLRYGFGNDNGIYVVEILFDERPPKVREALADAVRASRAKVKQTYGVEASTELALAGAVPTLICNLSN